MRHACTCVHARGRRGSWLALRGVNATITTHHAQPATPSAPTAGYPDIVFRPTAGPELLPPGSTARAPLQLYCCACGYRGPSATLKRCGLTRWLLAALTCGLGLACCGLGADVLHSCPRCGAHVATSRIL